MRNTDERQYQPVITFLNIRWSLSPVFLYPDFHIWPEEPPVANSLFQLLRHHNSTGLRLWADKKR